MKLLMIALKCAAGGTLVSVGTVLLVLPGPGLALIMAGIAVLATEFAWAASAQARLVALLERAWRAPAAWLARWREKSQRVPCTGCE